jgi:hypothetical protein
MGSPNSSRTPPDLRPEPHHQHRAARGNGTYRIHIKDRSDLLQPDKLIASTAKARLAGQVVCDGADIAVEPNCAELRKE